MGSNLLIVSGIYLVLVLVGQVFFKKAAASLDPSSISSFLKSMLLNFNMVIAVIAYFAAMFTWVWLLKHVDLSRIFPIMAALLLLTVPLVSSYFLEETLSLRYWLGVICMLAGIALIATEIKTV